MTNLFAIYRENKSLRYELMKAKSRRDIWKNRCKNAERMLSKYRLEGGHLP